ncbi:nickel-dependent hydrogenase large subunit [Paraneptunicella aestuarii]|uniref:Ni/Fe hydrogenase subunit alpha n=1 Tax=Paraneptunicella aestuarii TaxID=2831148 RepID=UPI001E431593|nr:nickel-dependent hydrogenase large subunit [Paraneptunicella aestuarii]UAA40591.1 nickel-dependent hydrogenase large subunit [Paraneptunicella aestuarii]
MTTKARKINLKVPFVTRLEGEGALELTTKGNDIDKLHLKIFEPPRLFESFLQGKSYKDVPDLSARICGICPMAYQLTSIQAMETLFGVQLPEHIIRLRRLMNLGEWLQSHALHIHFLAAPDIYGFDSALQMAGEYPEFLQRGMLIQEAGNSLMTLLGGRSVHPVGLQVGGFTKLPNAEKWLHCLTLVEHALPAAKQLVKWSSELELPDYSHDFLCVSLKGEKAFPINSGDIQISNGLVITPAQYPEHFKEHQTRHSTAFYSLLDGHDYLVGPLARMNNSFHLLHEDVKQVAKEYGLKFPNQNMHTSIQARALECFSALHESLGILQQGLPEGEANVAYDIKAGECHFCTEAPRGLIYHYYDLDDEGKVLKCSIIPPTSQNQARIEKDLHFSVKQFGLDKSDKELKYFCERIIRNYDPCISCSTHFLDFKRIQK